MTVFVADIASYQHGLIPAELRPACVGLWVKCTQGTGYVDPDYANWLAEAKASGLIVAAYHYVDGSSPAAQAANLKAHIGDPTLPVMVDFETGGLQQALEFTDACAALGLHVKLMYLAKSYWQSLGSPDLAAPFTSRGLHLIDASYRSMTAGTTGQLYPGDTAPEWNPYGGVTPALLQFTAMDELAGQLLDCNAYRGTAAQLAALLQTAPTPTPAPTAAPNTNTIAPEEEPMQIEPLNVHPGEYAFAFAPDKTELVLVADGYSSPGATLRIVIWGGNSPSVLDGVRIGGTSGHTLGHTLPAGATGVTIRREDHEDFPIGVAFQ